MTNAEVEKLAERLREHSFYYPYPHELAAMARYIQTASAVIAAVAAMSAWARRNGTHFALTPMEHPRVVSLWQALSDAEQSPRAHDDGSQTGRASGRERVWP